MRVTTPTARGRTAILIEMFVQQARHGIPDDFLAYACGVNVETVCGWRNGVMPKHEPGNLRAGLELALEEWPKQAASTVVRHRRLSLMTGAR